MNVNLLRHCRRLLVRHAWVMDRLRQEVLSVVGDAADPTREQIRRMPYLANVLIESMDISPRSKGSSDADTALQAFASIHPSP